MHTHGLRALQTPQRVAISSCRGTRYRIISWIGEGDKSFGAAGLVIFTIPSALSARSFEASVNAAVLGAMISAGLAALPLFVSTLELLLRLSRNHPPAGLRSSWPRELAQRTAALPLPGTADVRPASDLGKGVMAWHACLQG